MLFYFFKNTVYYVNHPRTNIAIWSVKYFMTYLWRISSFTQKVRHRFQYKQLTKIMLNESQTRFMLAFDLSFGWYYGYTKS